MDSVDQYNETTPGADTVNTGGGPQSVTFSQLHNQREGRTHQHTRVPVHDLANSESYKTVSVRGNSSTHAAINRETQLLEKQLIGLLEKDAFEAVEHLSESNNTN